MKNCDAATQLHGVHGPHKRKKKLPREVRLVATKFIFKGKHPRSAQEAHAAFERQNCAHIPHTEIPLISLFWPIADCASQASSFFCKGLSLSTPHEGADRSAQASWQERHDQLTMDSGRADTVQSIVQNSKRCPVCQKKSIDIICEVCAQMRRV